MDSVIDAINKNKNTRDTQIDLGNFGLTALPEEIFECTWLEKLYLTNFKWDNKEGRMVEKRRDQKINQIKSLDPRLANLRNLWHFEIDGVNKDGDLKNQVDYLEGLDVLSELEGLTTLKIENFAIRSLEFILSLRNLDMLTLDFAMLQDVSPIANLVNLRFLSLERNFIINLLPLKGLSNLRSLFLSGNEISDLHPIRGLSGLELLFINYNKIEDISPVFQMENLGDVWLGYNQIKSLPTFANFSNIHTLRLYGNQISNIEPLTCLKNLSKLDVSNNLINKIDVINNFKELTWINANANAVSSLSQNFLQNLDYDIELKPFLDEKHVSNKIFLNDNPISDPPQEVLSQGKAFAIEYLQNKFKQSLNECKVIIVGRGAVGKTSLQKRLVNDEDFESMEVETHGIRKVTWTDGVIIENGTPILIHFWDFGGQHIQQTLHQFFYSENTLYLLVLDSRTEESPEDFLDLIKVYSNSAPVIIVYNNKKDLASTQDIKFDLEPSLDSALRNKYPNIKKAIGVCCGQEKDEGVAFLRKYLKDLVPSLDHVRERYPTSWINIKNDLLRETKNYLSFESYESLCLKYGVNELVIQKGLAKMLNDIGTVTFFNRLFVGKYYILNPDWITTGAYEIILSPITRIKKGRITHSDLNKIFSDDKLAFRYQPHEYEFLLTLMREFDLCQEFKKNEWLIPSSLEGKSKTDLVQFKSGDFRLYSIEYKVSLPASIIYRFVARNIDYADANDYWKNGIVVKHPYTETYIYVEADFNDKEIRLWIKGQQIRDCWEFFRKDIHEFSEKFDYIETVLIDEARNTKVSFQDLSDLLNEGESFWVVPRFGKINIKEVLGLFESPERHDDFFVNSTHKKLKRESLGDALRAFVSYSKFDGEETNDGTNYLEEFKTALTPLTGFGEILSTWDDTLLIPGENWDRRIKNELNAADIVFVLVSNNLLKTRYITETELEIAFKREAEASCVVIPIIIRDCGWTDIPWISKINAIPRKGNTVSSWRFKYQSKDQIWKHIYDEIKKLIENYRHR